MRVLIVLSLVCGLLASASGFLGDESQENLLFGSANGGTSCPCSTPSAKRIVNGDETKPNEFPFMLAMIRTDTGEFFCGASILTMNKAITAAHCTYGRHIPITVIAGAYNLKLVNQQVQKSHVVSVAEHEHYKQSDQGLVNDIAILTLQTPLQFNAHVMPVCMPASKLNVVNQNAKIIGWGKTGLKELPSPVLLEMVAKISPAADCTQIFKIFDGTSMICANNPVSTACQGDSGGPVIWLDPVINRYTLVGLVSFGYPPGCFIGKPIVVTDVSAHLTWIQGNVPNGYCHKV